MRIAEVALTSLPDSDEVSALLGDFRLAYRVTPGVVTAASADAFLAAALLPAMARGEPLDLDPSFTASPMLLEGLDRLQEIFCAWNPALRRVSVIARAASPRAARIGRAAFFSGGLDSLYTFLDGENELSHAIQIHGFDYGRDNRALAEEAERRNRHFVEGKGRRLVVVESNHRELYDRHQIDVTAYHGGLLASVGLALGFERIHIPASHTWTSLFPWGSHPVTDPLWSTETVRIVHDGIAGRPAKLRRVGQDPAALALLRVCFQAYNCGTCEKCLRTRFALRALGLRSPALAPLDSTWPICLLRLDTLRFRLHWEENYALALEVGDRALARAVAVCLARADARHLVRRLDRLLLGGRARRLWRAAKRTAVRRPSWPLLLAFDPGDE
jgi:hypothetical protein